MLSFQVVRVLGGNFLNQHATSLVREYDNSLQLSSEIPLHLMVYARSLNDSRWLMGSS